MQLETIMYQSLDAAISVSDQYIKTNRLALLSAIIQNKINDIRVSNLSKSPEVARNVRASASMVCDSSWAYRRRESIFCTGMWKNTSHVRQ